MVMKAVPNNLISSSAGQVDCLPINVVCLKSKTNRQNRFFIIPPTPSYGLETDRQLNMESKGVKNSNVLLFGLSFNLILTLALLGFTCYSLQRLDSRLSAVERDLLYINHRYRLDNHVVVKPTSPYWHVKRTVVKRAAESSPLCRRCITLFCSNRKVCMF